MSCEAKTFFSPGLMVSFVSAHKIISNILENVSITLIGKNAGFQSKERENLWMKTLKTVAPVGFNAESIN